MGQPTIAPSCPVTAFLQSAPSLAYQEYCTIISFFFFLPALWYISSALCFVLPWRQEVLQSPGKMGRRRSLRKLSLLVREAWGRNLAVNGKRELRGQTWLCVQSILESTGPADAAFRMSCLHKPIFPRSRCSLGFHRNQG